MRSTDRSASQLERPADMGFWHIRICYIRSVSYSNIRIYTNMVAQQDLTFKMIHIETKSINIWRRYDPKQNITSCFHTFSPTLSFWVTSQPNVNGFCSNMDDFIRLPHIRINEYRHELNYIRIFELFEYSLDALPVTRRSILCFPWPSSLRV